MWLNYKYGTLLVKRDFGKDIYVGESLHIPSNTSNSGYLLNVVYNAEKDKSQVHLMHEDTLEDEAVAEIPYAIPFGYHGAWNNK